MCGRVRFTDTQVLEVAEVTHGFATGYKWECIDTDDCDKTMEKKLSKSNPGTRTYEAIQRAKQRGRKLHRYNNFTTQSF